MGCTSPADVGWQWLARVAAAGPGSWRWKPCHGCHGLVRPAVPGCRERLSLVALCQPAGRSGSLHRQGRCRRMLPDHPRAMTGREAGAHEQDQAARRDRGGDRLTRGHGCGGAGGADRADRALTAAGSTATSVLASTDPGRVVANPGKGAVHVVGVRSGAVPVISGRAGKATAAIHAGNVAEPTRMPVAGGARAAVPGGTWGKAQQVPNLSEISAVSCASPGDCSAGGFYYGTDGVQAFVISQDEGRWGKTEKVLGTAPPVLGRVHHLGVVHLGGQLQRRRVLRELSGQSCGGLRRAPAERPLGRGAADPPDGRDRLAVVRLGRLMQRRRPLHRQRDEGHLGQGQAVRRPGDEGPASPRISSASGRAKPGLSACAQDLRRRPPGR